MGFIKAQITIEFLFTIVLGFFFLTFMIYFVTDYYSSIDKNNVRNNIDEIGTMLKIEIDTAYSVSEGYTRKIILPQKIIGKDYNITIKNNEMTITADVYSFTKIIPPVVGNFTKGQNIIKKESEKIIIN